MMPWRRRARRWARRAVALVPAFVIATFIANVSVPTFVRLEVIVVLITTMVRPALGLVLVALLAPLGDIVVPIVGAPPVRHAETVVVAFLAAWLSVAASDDERRPALPANLVNAVWVFGGVLVASVVATGLQLHRESPAALQAILASLTHAYLLTEDGIGAHSAGQLLEGLALLGAGAALAQRPRDRFWLRLSLVTSGVVGSLASGLLVLHLAPMRTLVRHADVGLRRYSAISGDVNATASWCLLLVGVSLGVATTAGRTRRAWLLATLIMLAGLALTRSGAAVIAGAVVLSAAATRGMAFAVSRPWKIVAALVLVALVVGTIGYTRTARAATSIEMRGGFTEASMRFIDARPLFGIGAGRYYTLSKLALPPRLSLLYGRENAHDYYLQIAAELGLVGAVAFVWVLVAALRGSITSVWRGGAEGVTVGCVGGTSAYLVTALTGHPFLVPEAAIPFWVVLGLLVAQRTDPVVGSAWRRLAAIGFAAVLLLTTPLRDDVPRVRLSPGDDGFGPAQVDETGRPLREAGAFASLFVGPTITAVEIPMRLGPGSRAGSAHVLVSVRGSFGSDQRVDGGWSTLTVPLPGAELLMPLQRINLAVTPGDGGAPHQPPVVDIGQIRLVTVK